VLTTQEAGNAGQAIPDQDALEPPLHWSNHRFTGRTAGAAERPLECPWRAAASVILL